MQQMIHKCCVLLGKKFGSFDRGFKVESSSLPYKIWKFAISLLQLIFLANLHENSTLLGQFIQLLSLRTSCPWNWINSPWLGEIFRRLYKEYLLVNMFKCIESFFDIYCQSKDMADFHALFTRETRSPNFKAMSNKTMASKVRSINSEPPDNDLCSACHVYPLSRGVSII